MIDFQAAERQRLEEPASEIGLEPLCAMVCDSLTIYHLSVYFIDRIKSNLLLGFSIKFVCRLTTTCAAMILQWS